MNLVEIHTTLEQKTVSSEGTFPAAPFPRKHIHAAFHDFKTQCRHLSRCSLLAMMPGTFT